MTKTPLALLTVAGLRFYSYWNHPEDLTGKAVTFEPEPANPYDPKAIKIMLDGKQLGHVPRTQTGVIHDKLEKGFVVDGVITHHYPRAVVVQAFAEYKDSSADLDPNYGDQ